MSSRTAAWGMWVLSSVLTALSILLLVLTFSRPNVEIFDYWVESTVIPLSSSTVGALVASR